MRFLLIFLQMCFITLASSNQTTVKNKQTSPVHRYSHSNDDKIVGGRYVQNITECPYQVSVMVWGQHVCGGSLLTLDFIFSACHCFAEIPEKQPGPGVLMENRRLSAYSFLAGTLNIRLYGQTFQTGRAKSLHIHPKCGNTKAVVYDLALAKTTEPFVPTPFVKPVKMLSWDKHTFLNLLGKMIRAKYKPKCTVAGWGEIRRGVFNYAIRSDRLKIVQMYPMRDYACHRIWMKMHPEIFEGFSFWQHGQICAINAMLDSSDCVGDSGGPYVCDGEYLIGLVSYGTKGCDSEDPSVYSTVSELIPWVKEEFAEEIDTTEPQKTTEYRVSYRQHNTIKPSKKGRRSGSPPKSNQQTTSHSPLLVTIVLLMTEALMEMLMK